MLACVSLDTSALRARIVLNIYTLAERFSEIFFRVLEGKVGPFITIAFVFSLRNSSLLVKVL